MKLSDFFQDKSQESEDQQKAQDGVGLTRRDMLKRLVQATVALGGTSYLIDDAFSQEPHAEDPNSSDLHQSSEANEHSEEKLSAMGSVIDKTTLALIVEEFCRVVVANNFLPDPNTENPEQSPFLSKFKKGPLSLGVESAAEMLSLELLRAGLLKIFGGPEGEHIAKHEVDEVISGLIPVPILVFLADITTTELKIDVDAIFNDKSREILSADENPKIARPSIDADLEEWGDYLDSIHNRLVDKTAKEIGGLSTVLAPLGTTYTSSGISNILKADVPALLFEKYFAEVIIEANKSGQAVDVQQIRAIAIEKANKAMNGSLGYNSLVLALSCNAQGALGLGDPPELYFLLEFWNSPDAIAASEALGLASSEIQCMILTGIWLASIGIKDTKYIAKMFEGQSKTAEALFEAISSEKMRSLATGGGKALLPELVLLKKLNLADEARAEAVELLFEDAPKAKIQVRFQKYFREKAKGLAPTEFADRMEREDDYFSAISQELIQKVEEFGSVKSFEEIAKGIFAGNFTALEAFVSKFKNMQTVPGLESLSKSIEESLAKLKSEEAVGDGFVFDTSLDGLSTLLEEFNKSEEPGRILLALQQSKSASAKKISAFLASANQDVLREVSRAVVTVRESILEEVGHEEHSDHTNVEVKPTDFVSNMKEKVEGYVDKLGLSHSAKEVLFALMTQIPSVPALARLATIGVPALKGIKEGDPIDSETLKEISLSTLVSSAAISAVADNVAAYMFGKSVLIQFFERKYGKEFVDSHPIILKSSAIIAKMIAEQAGALTKYGNGPNFSQEVFELAEGIDGEPVTNKRKIEFLDTHKNAFAWASNLALIGASQTIISKMINDLDSELNTPAFH